jgi:glucose/arabinose dehydrogenase
MKGWLGVVASLFASLAVAQPRNPAPAFPPDAPEPRDKSRYRVEVITERLTGPWAVAFLPDGNFLVSERLGVLRTIAPDGTVSEPIAGVPPVKVVAAQSFHDIALDPDFAANRYVYFTYFAPPKGEVAKQWPNEHFYDEVWTKTLAERRVLDLGSERVGRGKLSLDNRRLEGVEVLIDGRAERRIVFARDKTLYVTGADVSLLRLDLDGVDHDFTARPTFGAISAARVIRINRDGTIRPTTRGSAAPWRRAASLLHGRDPEAPH